MKRTSAGVLLLAAAIGIAAGFLFDHLLTVSGRATFTPMVSLPILLVLLGAVVVILALPIRRATRDVAAPPVNPFRALRIAMLAKASSIVGAAVGGVAVGLGIYLLSRPVPPPVGSIASVIATAVCGALLVGAALVAEHMCIIRKDDDDEPPQLDSGAGASHP